MSDPSDSDAGRELVSITTVGKAHDANSDINWRYCDLCSYKNKTLSNLKKHQSSIHNIGTKWHHCGCDGCDFKCKNKDNQIVVKGVAKIDERAETILAYFILYTSNERNRAHIEINGNTERSWSYAGTTSHTGNVAVETRAPKPADKNPIRVTPT